MSSQGIIFLVEGSKDAMLRKILILLNIEDAPKTFGEATSLRDITFWEEAINNEMDSTVPLILKCGDFL